MSIRVKQSRLRRRGMAFAMAAVLSLGATVGAAAPTPSSHLSGLSTTIGQRLRHMGDTDIAQIIVALRWLHHAFPGAPITWMPGNGVIGMGMLLNSLESWLHDGQGGARTGGSLSPAEIFAKLTGGGADLYSGVGRGPARSGRQGGGGAAPPWTALLGGAQPFGKINTPPGNPFTFAALGGSGSGGTGGPGAPTINGGTGPSSGTSRAVQPSVVPLPATLPMLLLGLGGLAIVSRRRRPAA